MPPTTSEFVLPERWERLGYWAAQTFEAEPKHEASKEHLLFGKKVQAIARLKGTDDFLFSADDAPAPFFVVHLTWHRENDSEHPWSTPFRSFEDFLENWKRIWD